MAALLLNHILIDCKGDSRFTKSSEKKKKQLMCHQKKKNNLCVIEDFSKKEKEMSLDIN